MIDLMTKDDFQKLLNGSMGDYYKGRWEYFKEVIEIIKSENITNVLELGPGLLPIVKNSDIMLNSKEDHFGKPSDIKNKTKEPYYIKEKSGIEENIIYFETISKTIINKNRYNIKPKQDNPTKNVKQDEPVITDLFETNEPYLMVN